MRIGIKPYLFEMSEFEAIDMDWEEDLNIVKKLSIANEYK
jgi:CMP-N-acetylneuraminic acid synthetase